MPRARIGADGVTDREREFLLECLKDGDSIRAAMVSYRCKDRGSATKMAEKVLSKPRIKSVLSKLTETDRKNIRLRRNHVLQKLSDSLNRDLTDFVDSKQGKERGIVVSNLSALPKRTHAYVDGFEVEQFFDDPERPRIVTRQRIKVKLTSNASIQDMVMKFKGLYAAEKHANLNINADLTDWGRLLEAAVRDAEEEERTVTVEAEKEPKR